MCIFVRATWNHMEDQIINNGACFSSGDAYTLYIVIVDNN